MTTITPTNELRPRKSLRLWPAVVIALVQLLVMFVAPLVLSDDGATIGVLGGVAGALTVFLWWLIFSRAPWFERLGAIVLMIIAVVAARSVAHESIVGAGQGMMIYFLPTPYLALALVVWAVATRHRQGVMRYASLAAAILLACAPFALIRTAGIGGGAMGEFHWRWTPTPEQRLLAQVHDDPKPLPPPPAAAESPKETPAVKPAAMAEPTKTVPAPATVEAATRPAMSERDSSEGRDTPVEWPGFRGPNRDSVVRGVQIKTDWSASPPVEIWRRPVGPGWSSFAVHGDFLYTQEQRGDDEVVTCYRVSTGEPVWRHRDAVRFYESNGGAGPRGTPTLSRGRVYSSGATGILNALDEGTGAVLWSHQVATETKTPTPMWGFSSSPLVVGDLVIVAASGTLAAYDAVTGLKRWANPSQGGSYSSPHRVTIDGVEQVLLLGGPAVMSVAPADGQLLWEHKWEGGAIVQPAITEDGGILINAMSMTGGMGTRRLAVTRAAGAWTVAERWTSNGLKPYYNDFVLHKGHAYGFDNNILSCIDLEDGKRVWKGGRYGNGQLVMLADQDLLLVISEEGEVALVSATPDKFTEIARFRALDAKTWNHPVVVGDVLLVRNGEEMAAFRLSMAKKDTLEEK
ncbi:MAG: PQQ-binding-like beta-propeller repeat protein [Vicinamibacterales bacterium]